MSRVRGFRHRVEAGVFVAGPQSGGKVAFRVAAPTPATPAAAGNGRNAVLVHGNVVEVAKAILQVLECRKELLPALPRLLAWKHAGEELRRVADLLGLNAQLVTATGIELRQLLAPLANL